MITFFVIYLFQDLSELMSMNYKVSIQVKLLNLKIIIRRIFILLYMIPLNPKLFFERVLHSFIISIHFSKH